MGRTWPRLRRQRWVFVAEQETDAQYVTRIWNRPPATWPLQGSWTLRASLVVHGDWHWVVMYIDGSKRRDGGPQQPVWASRPTKGKRPSTYVEGIPDLMAGLWEFSAALRGFPVTFE